MCGQGKIKIIFLCLENYVFLKVLKNCSLTFEKKSFNEIFGIIVHSGHFFL